MAIALRRFMEMRSQWEGSTGDLFGALRPTAPQDFPVSAIWLGRKLNALRSSLGECGVEVEPVDLSKHGRGWRIRKRITNMGAAA